MHHIRAARAAQHLAVRVIAQLGLAHPITLALLAVATTAAARAWDAGHPVADTRHAPQRRKTAMDMWKGKPLADRQPVSDVDLHYRIYNSATGELLSFGSNGGPGSLNGIVQDALRTQAENPGVRLYVEQFEGPVY
ncbi:hypothetical protein ABZ424_30445 [Streptomyces sp. NPDC005790]|uniref:hypothetical protein n=1 Tax=Streptomyces sp. NPDC005790 TaxID=3154777 RepID=UPI0033F83581